jgi:hypothetical protein
MKLLLALLPATLLAACAAEVSHPTKTLAEQQVDIDQCTDQANRKYWMDPVAGLLNAYDCLEARGYKRGGTKLDENVERAIGEDRSRKAASQPAPQSNDPAAPCKVPCRRDQ